VELRFAVESAASGMPSTCEVLSEITSCVTAEPHAAVIANPTARTGGEVMIPWEMTMVVRLARPKTDAYSMLKGEKACSGYIELRKQKE